jgi:PadR family transcriptional regulator, regulatory protein AphA
MSTELPTTSYAVLGLLALRSWTGYELTQQGRRSMAFIWPKAESVIYEEPRRLVALGLARVSKERIGGRSRNRYAITDEGRAALRAWLARPSSAPRIEFEPVLRVAFADQGEIDDVLASIATLRDWAAENLAVGHEMFQAYRDGQAPFPERMHINVLGGHLLAQFYSAILRWAELVDKEIRTWDRTDGLGMTDRTRELLHELVDSWPAYPSRPRRHIDSL